MAYDQEANLPLETVFSEEVQLEFDHIDHVMWSLMEESTYLRRQEAQMLGISRPTSLAKRIRRGRFEQRAASDPPVALFFAFISGRGCVTFDLLDNVPWKISLYSNIWQCYQCKKDRKGAKLNSKPALCLIYLQPPLEAS